jgi:hypothetical protein
MVSTGMFGLYLKEFFKIVFMTFYHKHSLEGKKPVRKGSLVFFNIFMEESKPVIDESTKQFPIILSFERLLFSNQLLVDSQI